MTTNGPVTCPNCGHEQPAASYCAQCHAHMKYLGGVKDGVARLEAGLGEMRQHLAAAGGGAGPLIEAFKKVSEALRDLKRHADRIGQSQREMATLAEVGRAINSVLTMDRLFDLILDLAIKTMMAERGLLMLKDPMTGSLTVQASRDLTTESQAGTKSQLTISTNICSRVANEGQPILSMDAQSEARFQAMQSVMAHDLCSILCVPLKNKSGETIGVIYVDNRVVTGAFSEDSLELLSGIANQAVIAIENARLYENVQKETMARMNLQRYLSPNVVEDVMSQKEELTLGGRKVNCSVLFADIVGFTPLSQNMDPERVVQFLNEYFTAMSDIIFHYEGTLDKFIGDAIMAVFGAPVPTPKHARNAVAAAFAMQRETAKLREHAAKTGGLPFQVRIGVNSGEVVAGNIGSPSRIDYTVIGDNVNLAARLEPLAPPGGIIISEATYQLVKDEVQVKKLPSIEVKGRTGLVEMYEVVNLVERQAAPAKKDARQTDRIHVSLFAIYRDNISSRMYQGSIKNISSGGVQLITREAFAQGTELVLSFALPNGHKLQDVGARIVHAQELVDDNGRKYSKLGVQFTRCSDADRERIVSAWKSSLWRQAPSNTPRPS